VALRREDLFRDDGTDALTVCASVPLAYARLALALTDNYGWRYWGLSDDEEALMESGIGSLIEAMSRAGRCGMVGKIIAMLTDTLPDGCLWLDGQTYQADDYPVLHERLPSDLKDKNTFTLPDANGRFMRGTNVQNDIGLVGGENSVQLSVENMPSHSHTYTPPTFNLDIEAPGAPDLLAAGIGISTQTSSSGGDEPFDIIPPFVAVKYAIVAK
jgi:hypothetical protein